MEIEASWIPTILSMANDALKYNDGLRHSQTIRDAEDIEEWMLQISQFQQYLIEQAKCDPDLWERYKKFFADAS